jgi:hypothetical protein
MMAKAHLAFGKGELKKKQPQNWIKNKNSI